MFRVASGRSLTGYYSWNGGREDDAGKDRDVHEFIMHSLRVVL
jgi:hypothetical protein